MTRSCIAALVAVLAVGGALAGSSPAPTQAAAPDLSLALGRALAAPGVAASRTAALAIDLETGEVVFSRNERQSLAPASAEKLAVSFAALRLLGPGYRFRTEVAGRGELVGGVWRGDLFLVGHGDPTLRPADLDALSRDVAAWGIRRVAGRVLGDERHFDSARSAPGWKPWFVGIESPPLSALSVDDILNHSANGSAVAAARAFALALARRGVSVRGAPGTGRAPADVLPLASDLSEPLAEIVRAMNRESDNFVSEMLLKELGASVARHGSTRAGAEVVYAELRAAGVPLAGVHIADGSGLSRSDRPSGNGPWFCNYLVSSAPVLIITWAPHLVRRLKKLPRHKFEEWITWLPCSEAPILCCGSSWWPLAPLATGWDGSNSAKSSERKGMNPNSTTKSKSSHVRDPVRDTMETVAERSKEMPEAIGSAANEVTVMMQNSFSAMLYGMQEYHTKVVEFAQANTKSHVEYVQRLAGVKSPSEFAVISNDYARHQLTVLTEQAKDLAALAQKVATSTTAPLKTGVAKVPLSPV